MERDLQKHKQEQDDKTTKFHNMIVNFKDKVTKVFDNFQEIMQLKKGNLKYFIIFRTSFE